MSERQSYCFRVVILKEKSGTTSDNFGEPVEYHEAVKDSYNFINPSLVQLSKIHDHITGETRDMWTIITSSGDKYFFDKDKCEWSGWN